MTALLVAQAQDIMERAATDAFRDVPAATVTAVTTSRHPAVVKVTVASGARTPLTFGVTVALLHAHGERPARVAAQLARHRWAHG